MKKIIAILLCLTMLAVSVCALASCGNDTIIVNTNAFFAPFEYYEGTEIKGVDVEIMNMVGEKLGKKIEFQNTEFAAIIDNVRKVRFVMQVLPASPSPTREKKRLTSRFPTTPPFST